MTHGGCRLGRRRRRRRLRRGHFALHHAARGHLGDRGHPVLNSDIVYNTVSCRRESALLRAPRLYIPAINDRQIVSLFSPSDRRHAGTIRREHRVCIRDSRANDRRPIVRPATPARGFTRSRRRVANSRSATQKPAIERLDNSRTRFRQPRRSGARIDGERDIYISGRYYFRCLTEWDRRFGWVLIESQPSKSDLLFSFLLSRLSYLINRSISRARN